MAFSDPQSVTINAIANSLARTGSGTGTGTFKKDDGSMELLVTQKVGNRLRHTIRLNHNKVAVDPLVPTVNKPYSMSVIVTVDTPANQGYTLTEQKQVTEGLLAWLTASSGAKIVQLLAGEN